MHSDVKKRRCALLFGAGDLRRSVCKMNISRELFTKFRTPDEQSKFCSDKYGYINSNEDVKQKARLRGEPFKTFIEEFMPFTWFCEKKYSGRNDIECALVEGTPGRDGIIRKKGSSFEHNVEITYPIKGKERVDKAKQLNQKGYTDLTIWDYEDTSLQEEAINLTISIAKKKTLRDYRSDGGSTLIFVFDSHLFRESNEKHMQILNSLASKLSEFKFMADSVLLILTPEKKLVVIKDTEQQL